MRFADQLGRLAAALALGAGMAGCASVGEPLKATLQQAVAAVTPSPAASAASSPAAAAPVVAKPEPEAPVDATLQRAYDNARALLRAGRVDEAEKAFKALTQSNPELGGPHANLEVLDRQAGKLPDAVAHGELSVKANPQQPLYWNQLGVTYRQNGQFAKAREAYEKAIALDPGYAAPHLNLGILHDMYLGDGKRALELYDRYLALSPGGDPTVNKWVVDLRNRKPQPIALNRKEKE